MCIRDRDKSFGAPLITNDGVTIAKEIELEDAFENMGAQLVKEVEISGTTAGATERASPDWDCGVRCASCPQTLRPTRYAVCSATAAR